MKTILTLFLVTFFLTALWTVIPQEGFAQSSKKREKKSWKSAQLKNESPVYEAPNFDAPVKVFLSKGKKIRYLPKRYKGPGGFGFFYKITLRRGEYGYIVEDDIDISKAKTSKKKSNDSNNSNKKSFSFLEGNPFSKPSFSEEENMDFDSSIYLSRYIGLTYNSINYSEIINHQKRSTFSQFYGLKLSGPEVLIGAPLDLNLMTLFSPPRSYRYFTTKATGFTLIADLIFMLPMAEWNNFMIYYGIGPLLTYTRYNLVPHGNQKKGRYEEIRLGASFPLGLAFRFKHKFLLKAEVKYYAESQKYLGFQLGLQYAY